MSISISLVAVFIPLLLMGGIIGRLFREFAVTLSVAIFISMLVSLTTTPMMCAMLLHARDENKHGRFYHASEWVFDRVIGFYETTLRVVLRHRWITLTVWILTVALTITLAKIIPGELFPQQDTGRLTGSIRADQDTSFQQMNRLLTRFAQTVSADPAVDSVIAFAGGGRRSTRPVCLSHSRISTSERSPPMR